MVEIIPAILTDDPEELVRLAHILERAGITRVHLDICDGVFVPKKTVSGYEELKRLSSHLQWDVHLMVQDPEHNVDHWHACKNISRFIVHVEATDMMGQLAEHAHSHEQELWAAINPDTPIEKLDAASGIDGAMFLTVHPGAQGRPFVPETLDRMKAFHSAHTNLPIMADGGVGFATAPQCAAAGATILVSGSAIISAPDVKDALEHLRQSVS